MALSLQNASGFGLSHFSCAGKTGFRGAVANDCLKEKSVGIPILDLANWSTAIPLKPHLSLLLNSVGQWGLKRLRPHLLQEFRQ